MKLGEKKNEIRIVKEIDANYTFVDTTPLNLKQECKPNSSIMPISVAFLIYPILNSLVELEVRFHCASLRS